MKGTLFVRRGHRIAFDFDQPVDALSVERIEVEREGSSTRWSGTVPRTLPDGFRRVGIAARWSGGDQQFEAGLHVIRRSRAWVRVPPVRGPYLRAIAALERRGLRWRLERGGPRFFDSQPAAPAGSAMAPARPVRTQSVRPGRRVRSGTAVLLGF